MKHCPTCGQVILPSMGKRTAKAIEKTEKTTQQLNGTITATINDTLHTLDTTPTPRGHRGTTTIHTPDGRYRLRINITTFPRRNLLGGNIATFGAQLNRQINGPVTTKLPQQAEPSWTIDFALPWGGTTTATITIS